MAAIQRFVLELCRQSADSCLLVGLSAGAGLIEPWLEGDEEFVDLGRRLPKLSMASAVAHTSDATAASAPPGQALLRHGVCSI